tara:strand:+ start:6839 stop:7228 length:390 start_codon:yes stop_codon:yes gene_type:complete
MARLAGINIPDNKQIRISLTSIYGVGRSESEKLLKEAGINPGTKTKDLQAGELTKLRDLIEKNLKIEGELRREIMMNIKRLRDTGTWRGTRHAKRLPVRGQRTKTNTRTIRGNVRKTVGSGKKPPASPT